MENAAALMMDDQLNSDLPQMKNEEFMNTIPDIMADIVKKSRKDQELIEDILNKIN